MDTPINILWCQVRERRRGRVLEALRRLVESKETGWKSMIPDALYEKSEFVCAYKAKATNLEPSWVLVRKHLWPYIGVESYYSPYSWGKETEYIFVQMDERKAVRRKDDKIVYLQLNDAKEFMKSFHDNFQIRQYEPLTKEGLPDGTVYYRYSGGTCEGMLCYDAGILKELTKRPFGYSLDMSLILTDEHIQAYRKEYKKRRGVEAVCEFDPWGSHSEEIPGMTYHMHELKTEWLKYLRDTDQTKELLLNFRED
jgi:hypothetical protein